MSEDKDNAVLRSPVMTCSVAIDYLTPTGTTRKTTNYKNAKVLLGRNQFRDMLLHCENGSMAHKFSLRDFQLHKRFMREGKATIELKDQKIRFMISNAPPNVLLVLLKTLVGKNSSADDEENKPLGPSAIRQRLLSTVANSFDEISPLTVKEYQNIRSGGTCAQLKERTANKPSFSSPVSSKRKRSGLACDSPSAPAIKRRPLGPAAGPSPIVLSAEQTRVLRAVQAGHNVFFTGSAGTGKSFLLRRLVGALPPDATAVTASTGVAACHLAGTTLHGFAGIGRGNAPLEQCITQASRKGVLQNWRRVQHLIIDEISMVDGEYFQKLEGVARAVRNNDKPFGGIQLILCGDFLQLPPVSRTNNATFAFQTTAWSDSVHLNIELTQVRRQDDSTFIDVLQEIRQGRCSEATTNVLRSTSSNQLSRDGILATRLCTHREDVEHINSQHLASLAGEKRVFTALDTDTAYTKQLDAQTPVLAQLVLKVGAQVMLMKNLSVSEGLVNGARGVIKSFAANRVPVVQFACGVQREVSQEKWNVRVGGGLHVTRRQLPLKLAWAFSIHKSQGMTLELVEMSLSRVFEAGQAYVALSRARNLAGLRVLDFTASCIKANPAVVKFYRSLNLSEEST